MKDIKKQIYVIGILGIIILLLNVIFVNTKLRQNIQEQVYNEARVDSQINSEIQEKIDTNFKFIWLMNFTDFTGIFIITALLVYVKKNPYKIRNS